MYGLIHRWVYEDTKQEIEAWTSWFETEDELNTAYHNARMYWLQHIKMGRLILHRVVKL